MSCSTLTCVCAYVRLANFTRSLALPPCPSYKSFFDTQDSSSELVIVNISMPATSDSILKTVSAYLDVHGDSIYLASFSHIASLPAVVLPVKQLVALCASHGILTLIDGAHALGQIPVNVTDINATFWLGNGHKWLQPQGLRHTVGAKGLPVLSCAYVNQRMAGVVSRPIHLRWHHLLRAFLGNASSA